MMDGLIVFSNAKLISIGSVHLQGIKIQLEEECAVFRRL